MAKNLPANAGDASAQVWSLGQEDPLEKGMATNSSVLAWRIPGQRSLGGYSPWAATDSAMKGQQDALPPSLLPGRPPGFDKTQQCKATRRQ